VLKLELHKSNISKAVEVFSKDPIEERKMKVL
jgi:hypothetical protein